MFIHRSSLERFLRQVSSLEAKKYQNFINYDAEGRKWFTSRWSLCHLTGIFVNN